MINLKELRVNRGITAKQVCDKAGISECYYSQIENQKRKPSVEMAKKLAPVFGVNWTNFFE